jgi:hypothetical protein
MSDAQSMLVVGVEVLHRVGVGSRNCLSRELGSDMSRNFFFFLEIEASMMADGEKDSK